MILMHRVLIGTIFYCLLSSIGFGKEVKATLDLTKGLAPLSQQIIKVNKNDVVRLVISSDEPGDLHLHAYHLSVHLDPKMKSVLDFKAFATGRFTFEWHSGIRSSLPQMGHQKALATLEVFPE
jgi:hypothetical protein